MAPAAEGRAVVRTLICCGMVLGIVAGQGVVVRAAEDLAAAIQTLNATVLPESERQAARHMVRDDQRRRLRAANARSTAAWRKIDSAAAWQAFTSPRIAALRKSLGPKAKNVPLNVRGTKKIAGDGFTIENILFQSRPGVWAPANLYLPGKPVESAPGILICHSHHAPKTSGELQDMGMTWARLGCVVLVMDQLGYGERLQHPFRKDDDYAGDYRRSRQPYYFRYDTGIQLHLAGESLIGWMVHDLSRGVDVLLDRDNVDPRRIVLLGSVAGGGDPAAVCAAVDPRIQVAVPFNFGGPQPETVYPLPEDPEAHFNYAGSGGWESTRNLRRSAADGFLPWVIVGSIAPRHLIYAHEFAWDRPHDPVWKRLESIYELHDARGRLSFVHGRGNVKLRPPEATHCTHIGREHRKMIHPALASWLGMAMSTDDEYSARRERETLHCWTEAARAELPDKQLVDWLPGRVDDRLAAARGVRSGLPRAERRRQLAAELTSVLGRPDLPAAAPPAKHIERGSLSGDGLSVAIERGVLHVETDIDVPYLLLLPESADPMPCVLLVAQSGKQKLLAERSAAIAELLGRKIAVCLPDVRGTGETREDAGRGAWSTATARSSTDLMLGRTTLGMRLYDAQCVIAYLRAHAKLDPKGIAVWGDSLAAVNGTQTPFRVPRRVDRRPVQSEPLGGTLALLIGLCDEQIAAVYSGGNLVAFGDVLRSQFVQIPHDIVVPGWLSVADLSDLTAAIAPRPLHMARSVDGFNRRVSADAAAASYSAAMKAYSALGARHAFSLGGDSPAAWFSQQLDR